MAPGPGPAPSPPADRILDAGARAPWLVLQLDSTRYALPLASVSDLVECGALRQVPRAPEWVLGLAERRGRIVTVLDLARILGHPPVPGPCCLVRLAHPYEHLALAVPAAPQRISLVSALQEEQPADGPGDLQSRFVLLDPESLLAAAESGAAGATRPR